MRVAYLPMVFSQEEIVLTSKNAGGSCTHPTYMLNPQYHLRLHTPVKGNSQPGSSMAKASVVFTVQGARDIPVNVTLVWSKGERIGGWVSIFVVFRWSRHANCKSRFSLDWRRRKLQHHLDRTLMDSAELLGYCQVC